MLFMSPLFLHLTEKMYLYSMYLSSISTILAPENVLLSTFIVFYVFPTFLDPEQFEDYMKSLNVDNKRELNKKETFLQARDYFIAEGQTSWDSASDDQIYQGCPWSTVYCFGAWIKSPQKKKKPDKISSCCFRICDDSCVFLSSRTSTNPQEQVEVRTCSFPKQLQGLVLIASAVGGARMR